MNTTQQQRVVVVIPVYNRARVLLRTLQSVLDQTHPPDKLVIVDDGSDDDTADVAEQWLENRQCPFQWQIIRKAHTTAADTRERGFAEVAEQEYVAFLDSDDHWPADFLARTVDAMDRHPRAVAISADRRAGRKNGKILNLDSSFIAVDPIVFLYKNDAGIASCSLFRASAIESAGRWSSELETGEDFTLFLKIAKLGTWLYSEGDPVYFDRDTAKSGDEGNLSRRSPSLTLDWAQMYEHSYPELCRDFPHIQMSLKEGISNRWHGAGKAFLKCDDLRQSAHCHRNALRWNQRNHRARFRWLLMSSFYFIPPLFWLFNATIKREKRVQ